MVKTAPNRLKKNKETKPNMSTELQIKLYNKIRKEKQINVLGVEKKNWTAVKLQSTDKHPQ